MLALRLPTRFAMLRNGLLEGMGGFQPVVGMEGLDSMGPFARPGYLPGAFANLARRYTKNLVKSLRKVGRIAKSNTVSDFRNRTGIAL